MTDADQERLNSKNKFSDLTNNVTIADQLFLVTKQCKQPKDMGLNLNLNLTLTREGGSVSSCIINGRADSIQIGKHITVEDSTLIPSLVEDSTLHYLCGQFTEHMLENAATTSARPFGEYELPASGTES